MEVADSLVKITEKYLTRRRVKQYIRKERSKRRHFIIDWLDAFLWAAGVVLLLNQYLIQAYQIPSPSMEKTLIVGDRIFVNKLVYGPELLPGIAKLPSPIKPKRGDIIIFENPQYISQGPIFDVLQRIIYMLTLSMVDIDKNPDGTPKHHFLIKRAAAADGDTIKNIDGYIYFKPEGESEWLDETTYRTRLDQKNKTQRLIKDENYNTIRLGSHAIALNNSGATLTSDESSAYSQIQTDRDYFDLYSIQFYANKSELALNRTSKIDFATYYKDINGQFVPHGWILPLGDNRDNSKDGRSFGIISKKEVLGQAMIKYWPLNRFGLIK
ncbi:signal peptidase I [Spirochaeta cellobiosiphila]|uniref:signal peptidase I n=1 Tax=Spirochaeta cellobiosiphila TaxID=504483 RepID=UPI000409AB77|nr:signal peptidase I [Spirochaeta cellobiosiphila]